MAPLGSACLACHSINPRAASFCMLCGDKLPEIPACEALSPAERHANERRHITMVFCDLVGSSALATSIDAEDFTEIIGAVLRLLTEVTERFGGFVAHYQGDGTLSSFGYPSANEDDTERAVRAALAMVEAVAAVQLPDGRRLAARVGISAGEVVVGDIVGMRRPRGLDMAGELPSLAARLQMVADPGAVVVDGTVFRTVGELFDCRGLGERELKGWRFAVPVWQVLRPVVARNRFEAHERSRLAPLVGRTSEAALLRALWETARTGHGRAVLLRGEPGIGKSRLVADLLQQVAGESHTRLHYACSALQQGVSLAPCIRGIERAAGFKPDDGPETRRAKLRAAMGAIGEADFELMSGLFGLPTATPAATSQLPPHKRRQRTIAALINNAIRAAEISPVLAVFEDAHWIDPTSAELVDLCVRTVAAHPVLLVVTGRPEFKPVWADHANADIIELTPLSAVETRELIGWVAGEGTLPRDALRDIAGRSDGVPLFIEEVTKAFLESGAAPSVKPDRQRAAVPVPPAIHSSLLARLDRLGPAREVAEVAAAIGRDFSRELLARVLDRPEAALQPAIDRLTASGLVLPCSPGKRQFRFKHALIQDAAYGIVMRSQRRTLYARIVTALEQHFPTLAATEPALLAHHCTEAGFTEKAVGWWLRAGTQSLLRSAMPEALAQLARGLAAAEALPATRARDQLELDLRIAYAKALIATQGHAAPRTGYTFAIARDLCERLGRPPQYLTVLHGQWTHAITRADFAAARRQAEEILCLAAGRSDESWLLVGSYCLGMTCLPLGSFQPVCDHLRRGLTIVAAQSGAAYVGPIMPDPAVVMRTYLSWALLCMGHLDDARRECVGAVEDARRLGQVFTLTFALWMEAYLTLTTVSAEAALPLFEQLQQLAGEHGIVLYETTASLFLGWLRATLGDCAGGLAMLREGCASFLAAGNLFYLPTYMRMEAEILGLAGQPDDGLRVLDQAERLKDETGAHWDEAEFGRLRGELLWACGRRTEAEAAFRHAMGLARLRSAKLFELRAAIAYAGRQPAAASQLAPLCAWFEGRGGSSDLTQAHRILDTAGLAAPLCAATADGAGRSGSGAS